MLFTPRAKALIKEGQGKYVMKTVECIDMQTDMLFVKSEDKDELLSIPKKKKPLLKQFVCNTSYVKIQNTEEKVKGLYTGDILNISNGKFNNNYEVIVLNGKIKGREIKTLMVVDLEKILQDERKLIQLTNLHRDGNGKIIEYER